VLGVYFIATAISDAGPIEVMHWLRSRGESGTEIPEYAREITSTSGWFRYGLWGAARIAIGIALFFGSGSLSRAWYILRTSGHNREDPSA
jgi:hypothetical protein